MATKKSKATPKAQAKARKPINPKETARRAKPIAQVKGKPKGR